jgi:hypothetical protein
MTDIAVRASMLLPVLVSVVLQEAESRDQQLNLAPGWSRDCSCAYRPSPYPARLFVVVPASRIFRFLLFQVEVGQCRRLTLVDPHSNRWVQPTSVRVSSLSSTRAMAAWAQIALLLTYDELAWPWAHRPQQRLHAGGYWYDAQAKCFDRGSHL